jgi:hypothetical protein
MYRVCCASCCIILGMLISIPGFGKIRGRRILLTADDFTLRAGHADGALMLKTMYMEQLCVELKLPMIKLVDGASGGGSVSTAITCSERVVTTNLIEITTYRDQKGSYLPDLMLLKWIVSLIKLITWLMSLNLRSTENSISAYLNAQLSLDQYVVGSTTRSS